MQKSEAKSASSASVSSTSSKSPPKTPPTVNNSTNRPMNWSSIIKDGNVVNVNDVASSWLTAGKKGPIASHGGKILPRFQKKNTDDDDTETKDSVDPDSKNTDVSGDDNGRNTKTDKDLKFPVFIIFSQWTIPEIEDHMYSMADNEDQIGTVRIDYFKGEQTDRTIVVMDPSLYHKFRDDPVQGFSITPYDIRPHWYPHEKIGETFNFFIPLPSILSAAACREGLRVKMKELVHFGMFKSENDYGIFIPIANREGTEHTNRAYVEFDSNVDSDAVVMARCVLSYSKWSYKNNHLDSTSDVLVKCYYKKDNRTDRNEGGRYKNKGGIGKSSDYKSDARVGDYKSPPKTSARPRVALKIPTIPVDGDNINPFEMLSKENDTGDDNNSE